MEKKVRYPVGEQSFEALRNAGLLYVDKTRFIEQLLDMGGKYFFLGRPRRFGKSLFLSTLECFFQGKRSLFSGLYADSMDWDWAEYPVLHLDLNIERYKGAGDIDAVVVRMMEQWEAKYGISKASDNLSVRFSAVIEAARAATGRQVVILVDEYDKPLVSNLHDKRNFELQRDKLSSLYSNFKSSAAHIKMVFLTGVSRFAHLSVFSGLNNISDISFDDDFSDICGITDAELRQYFPEGIGALVRKFGLTEEQILQKIKEWYDGYRFSGFGCNLYNPFSLLNLMQSKKFENYWIHSGQATILLELLKRRHANLEEVVNSRCTIDDLKGLDYDNVNIVALLYQTGYITIKDYNELFNSFNMKIPNEEVTGGFLSYLLPAYARLGTESPTLFLQIFAEDLMEGRPDDFMRRLQVFFADISYELEMENERNFQNAFYILMKVVGIYVEAERRTSNGRIDLFFRTDKYLYIIELKVDETAERALAQIEAKDYALPFAADSRRIIRIGASFSSKQRTLTDWLIQQS